MAGKESGNAEILRRTTATTRSRPQAVVSGIPGFPTWGECSCRDRGAFVAQGKVARSGVGRDSRLARVAGVGSDDHMFVVIGALRSDLMTTSIVARCGWRAFDCRELLRFRELHGFVSEADEWAERIAQHDIA